MSLWFLKKWTPWKPVTFSKSTQSRLVPIQIHAGPFARWTRGWQLLDIARKRQLPEKQNPMHVWMHPMLHLRVIMHLHLPLLHILSILNILQHTHSIHRVYKRKYSVLNSIWPISGLSEFWKKTLCRLQLSSCYCFPLLIVIRDQGLQCPFSDWPLYSTNFHFASSVCCDLTLLTQNLYLHDACA